MFDASILLLIAVELVPLLSINFISVKLFECYFGPLVRCIDTCWCYLKGDINCNYYYYYYYVQISARQIGHSVANGSSTSRHFFELSCADRVQ